MSFKNQSVTATYQDKVEFSAVRTSISQWRFEPPELSLFAEDSYIPPSTVVYGTSIKELDLYSIDPNKAVFAAWWIISQYTQYFNQWELEWNLTGIPEYEEPTGDGVIF